MNSRPIVITIDAVMSVLFLRMCAIIDRNEAASGPTVF